MAVAAIAAMTLITTSSSRVRNPQWSIEKANKWYQQLEWPVGCNYVTSTAVNQLEMWQDETFDPTTIDRELGYAEDLGFNTLRIFLHNLLWEYDKESLKKNLDTFLSIADKHGMKCVVTFFTNGGSYNDPKVGPQPAPKPGIHNSQWLQTPGRDVVNDPSKWPVLKEYVQDVLKTFKNDDRILCWCLYNEPENKSKNFNTTPLLKAVFSWAREIKLSQPITAPVWGNPSKNTVIDILSFVCENSDIISFHCYNTPKIVEDLVAQLKRFGRPVICTEYMDRPVNTFKTVMPILKKNNVGAINWGLIPGKLQTNYPWGHKATDPEPKYWFHDILYPDGTPYDQSEVDFIKSMTKDKTMKF